MHGWAGIIGGLVSAIVISFADETFGSRYDEYFYDAGTQTVRSTSVQAGY